MYQQRRDAYLAHVNECRACGMHLVDYWDGILGIQIQYWAITHLCPEANKLLALIEALL